MERQKQVLHFEAKAGFTTAQSNEHQRRWTEKGWERANDNGRIDRTRTDLNFEIVRGGKVQAVDRSKSIPEKFQENISARGIKDPNASCPDNPRYRTVVDFIISGSHDRLHELAYGSQVIDYDKDADNSGVTRHPEIEQWAKDMYDVLSGKFGEENILSFVVHLDERSPHIHADLIPVTDDNRISFSKVFCGPDKYEFRRRSLALHDLFAGVNKRWGLERGDSVDKTHRKHQSTEEYRRQLSGENSTLEREVEKKGATLSNLEKQIRLAETRIKGLTTMITNLNERRSHIEKLIDDIHRKLSDGNTDPERRQYLQMKEESLQGKLDDILSKDADKQAKLEDADTKLADLKTRLSESQQRQDDLQKQIASATSQVSQISMDKVGSEALWTVLRDFQNMVPHLAQEELEPMEDSMLMDMSRRGMKIIACAALLSMGMVDQATNFAQNCGGGGGGHKDGWGKRPDEDEREWLRRCLARSRQMLQPKGRKLKR